jgi:hypothetical protein
MPELFRAVIDFARAHPLVTVAAFGVVTWAVLYLLWRKSQ